MSRKLPALTSDTADFWQGGRNGQLRIHHCNACRRFFHPPAPVCHRCASVEVGPQAVSGRATVISYTVNHERWSPGLEVPYVVAIVEIVEEAGLRLVTNIVNCPASAVHAGMPVRVRFEQHEDIWLPLFEPHA